MHTLYQCPICLRISKDREEIERCEEKGVPNLYKHLLFVDEGSLMFIHEPYSSDDPHDPRMDLWKAIQEDDGKVSFRIVSSGDTGKQLCARLGKYNYGAEDHPLCIGAIKYLENWYWGKLTPTIWSKAGLILVPSFCQRETCI